VCAVVVPVGGVAAAAPRAPLGRYACDARGLLACGGCRSSGSIRVKQCRGDELTRVCGLCAWFDAHLVRLQEVTADFSTARGGFKPAVPVPKPGAARRTSKEARQAAFERVLKHSQADAGGDEPGGLRALFREARAFQQNAELRAQAGQMRAMLAKRSRANAAKRGRKNKY
jgi:hypothetical protein